MLSRRNLNTLPLNKKDVYNNNNNYLSGSRLLHEDNYYPFKSPVPPLFRDTPRRSRDHPSTGLIMSGFR